MAHLAFFWCPQCLEPVYGLSKSVASFSGLSVSVPDKKNLLDCFLGTKSFCKDFFKVGNHPLMPMVVGMGQPSAEGRGWALAGFELVPVFLHLYLLFGSSTSCYVTLGK